VAIIRTRAVVISGAIAATEDASTADQLSLGSNVASAPTTTSFVDTQEEADNLAGYLAATAATEAPLVKITLDADSTTRLEQMRDVELNDRVIATEAITGGTLDGFVEQVTHRITNGGLRHECELVVGARTRMVGIYSPDSGDQYELATYSADNPAEPPPYATYGF
jgi:hypothetical protein